MKSLSPTLVKTVSQALQGARLAKFLASIAVLNESLAQGGWTKRGSVKAQSGFYQGITQTRFKRNYFSNNKVNRAQEHAWQLDFCLQYGRAFQGDFGLAFQTLKSGYRDDGEPVRLKLSEEQILAWVDLCDEKDAAFELLNNARPLPVITPIGLSPKVTKTLQECNLDIDLSSIRLAKIVQKSYWGRDPKTGNRVKMFYSEVVWTKGILHGQSRFTSGCEACGKRIPSMMFVPIEAKDKRSGKLISMWLGCDCAANIFGVKDIGVRKDGKKGK